MHTDGKHTSCARCSVMCSFTRGMTTPLFAVGAVEQRQRLHVSGDCEHSVVAFCS
jgi:hypothetical protein